MFKRSTSVLLLSLIVCFFTSACSVAVTDDVIKTSPEVEAAIISDTEVIFEETDIPESEWQLDVTFPDWRGDISSTFFRQIRIYKHNAYIKEVQL